MAPTKASHGTLHYVEETVYKAQKALIAAKFNGVELKAAKFDCQKDVNKPDFAIKNPTGKVPFLETDMGCIFTSNAIARYIARCRADTSLYGKSFDDEGKIDTWMEFCTHEMEVPLMAWVYPVMGLVEDIPAVTSDAKEDVKKACASLEGQLSKSKFLIGDFITLADIVAVCTLREGFVRVFDQAFRKPFPKVCSWFGSCCKLPQFEAVLGSVTLCAKAETPKPVLAKFAPPARKQEAAPKAQPTKEEPKKNKASAKAATPAKADAPAPASSSAAAPSGGADDAEIKRLGDEIRALKESLKAEGLSGKKINDHEKVKELVAKLNELKAGAAAAPPPAPTPAPTPSPAAAPSGGASDAEIKRVGDEIRTLKESLKAEGLSGKKINDHEKVKELVAKLNELKAGAAAAPPPAPTPAATQAPVPAAAENDLEAQIKKVGDDLRALKEKLKKEDGLTGKQLNEHADVKTLVAQLTELKKKQ